MFLGRGGRCGGSGVFVTIDAKKRRFCGRTAIKGQSTSGGGDAKAQTHRGHRLGTERRAPGSFRQGTSGQRNRCDTRCLATLNRGGRMDVVYPRLLRACDGEWLPAVAGTGHMGHVNPAISSSHIAPRPAWDYFSPAANRRKPMNPTNCKQVLR